MAGESLANGGRLGLSALNIKNYKDQALNDEILLDKDTGLFYYKNPQGKFISMDMAMAKQSYINTVRNELDDMGITNYTLTDLTIDPNVAVVDKNIVNISGTNDDYIIFYSKTIDKLLPNYLYLGLDIIGFYDAINGFAKDCSILDSHIPFEIIISPSTDLSIEYVIPFTKRIIKFSDYVSNPPSNSYPVIKSIKITDMSSVPSDVNYFVLNALIAIINYQ